jgi:hypothetical protein
MKKTALIILFSALVGVAAAQESYTKLYDKPGDALKGHISLELYGVDVGFSNITGSMIFAVGANARYPISDKLEAEGLFRLPLLRFEKQGAAFMTDAGVLYKFSSQEAPSDVRIILAFKEEKGVSTITRTTKYVDINGSLRKSNYLRGGAYLRNSSFDYKSDGTTDYKTTSIFHKGVYLGLGRERQYFFQLQRSDGAKFGAGGKFMVYADVLVLPVNVDVTVDTFGLGPGATKELSGLLGGRIGFKWYRNPFTRAQNFNRRIPFFGNTMFTMEAGVRPLEGMFLTGGFTYIIHKF